VVDLFWFTCYPWSGGRLGGLVKVLSQQAAPGFGTNVRLTGSLQNVSHSRLSIVRVAGVALARNGSVMDVSSQDCCYSSLRPGEIGSFTITFQHASGANAFRVFAQATPSY
jgi:hypothetical protein